MVGKIVISGVVHVVGVEFDVKGRATTGWRYFEARNTAPKILTYIDISSQTDKRFKSWHNMSGAVGLGINKRG